MKVKTKIIYLFFLIGCCINTNAQILSANGVYKGCAPMTLRLFTASPLASYSWNSTNFTTSTKDTFEVLFTNSGTYTITVGSYSRTIEVLDKPLVNILSLSPLTGCLPFTFTVKDNSSYSTGDTTKSYMWVLGNGDTASGNPMTHTITNYEPKVSVDLYITSTMSSCNTNYKFDSFYSTLSVPKTKIIYSPKSSCKAPLTVNFTNNTTASIYNQLTYKWSWANPIANQAVTKDITPITFSTPGTYKVYLKSTNQYGCSSIDTATVKIKIPTGVINCPDTVCYSPNNRFVVVPKAPIDSNYSYSFNSSYFSSYFNDSFYHTTASTQGSYPLTMTMTNKDDPTCVYTFVKNIFVIYPVPLILEKSTLKCSLPFLDTVIAKNMDKYTDSIFFIMIIKDKYTYYTKQILYVDFQNIGKKSPDSMAVFRENNIYDKDSFYRKEKYIIEYSVTFYNKLTNCTNSASTDRTYYELFSGFIFSNKLKTCTNSPIAFEAATNSDSPIKSVHWYFGDGKDTVVNNYVKINHSYTSKGVYKAYAIVYSSTGCLDTTNPLWIHVGDSIPPTIILDKTTFCIHDTLTIKNNPVNKYEKYYFLVDNYSYGNCGDEDSVKWTQFRSTGTYNVTLITEKEGCLAKSTQSITVLGASADLDYDFNCLRRDSILFLAKNRVGTSSFQWDFGDGTPLFTTTDTSVWHKYTTRGDYLVKLISIDNLASCNTRDSTWIHIRNVKAVITVDSLQCRVETSHLYNDFPYTLDPTRSFDADYLCSYNYTWYFTGAGVTQRPITVGAITKADFESTHFTLNLIARDINGCADTTSQSMWVDKSNLDFSIDKLKLCRNVDQFKITNNSTSPFGFRSYKWSVLRRYSVVEAIDSVKNPLFSLHTTWNQRDTFDITLTASDSANCSDKSLTKTIVFYRDTFALKRLNDTICQYSACNVYYTDSSTNSSFTWYLDNVKMPDNTYILKSPINTLGKHTVKLIKKNILYGCIDSFTTTIFVKIHPRLRMDNSADTSKILCFPSITTAKIVDSTLSKFTVTWKQNNNPPTVLNPSTFSLAGGVNLLTAIVTTDYGCIDTLYNRDTVQKPSGLITVDRPKICKGDSILFILKNKVDVDSFVWNFGDGTSNSAKKDTVFHRYSNANLMIDSTYVGLILYGVNAICPQAISKVVYILEAKADFDRNHGLDTAYCFSSSNFYNKSPKGDYFKWDMGDQNTLNTKDVLNYQYKTPGTYTVKMYSYRSPLGCVDSSIKKIILFPLPKVTLTLDTICLGDTAKIFVTDTLSPTKKLLYRDSSYIGTFSSNPIKFYPKEDSIYKVVSISDHNCKDSATISTHVVKPFHLPTLDTIVKTGDWVILPLNYNSKYTYKWIPKDDSFTCQHCSNPMYQVLYQKEFVLEVTDDKHCFTIKTNYKVDVYPDIKVVVPTAFTPNGDGINDILYARGFGIKKLNYLKIFNRVGQLVFESHDEKDGWDGYYKGVVQNSEPYFYYYEATSYIPGKTVSGEGNFMLLK